MRRLQKRRQNHQKRTQLERQQRSFLGNGGRKFREGGKTSETNARSSETAAEQSASAQQTQKQRLRRLPVQRQQVRAGLSQC